MDNDNPGAETYRLLLEVKVEATQAPEQAIPALRRLLKALLRAYGFRCRDAVQVNYPRRGAPRLPEEDDETNSAA
jgi:hypothetical protein